MNTDHDVHKAFPDEEDCEACGYPKRCVNLQVESSWKPALTARYSEDLVEDRVLASAHPVYTSVGIEAEVVYQPGDTQAALAAVDRLAEALRLQIANSAEGTTVRDH